SLVDTLTKIMGNPEGNDNVNEEHAKGANNEENEVEKALKALEGKVGEVVNKEFEDGQRSLSPPNTTIIKNNGKKISSPSHQSPLHSSPSASLTPVTFDDKVEQVKQDED